jgi:hypothetical protein
MIRIVAGRRKSRITGHFFSNLGLSGFFGENGFITSLKNVPNRPFWMANRLSDGLLDRERGKRGGFDDTRFQDLLKEIYREGMNR